MEKGFLKVLEQIATEHGVSVFEVKKDMQEAIDVAWNNGKPNAEFEKTFGKTKPTIDEFVAKIVSKLM